MTERNRSVYCTRCGSIVDPGNTFCGVCGAKVSPDAQDAAPTQEIPTQVYPPPNVPSRGGDRGLAVVLGLGALMMVVLAVGAIVGLNLLGGETTEQGGAGIDPATTPTAQEDADGAPPQGKDSGPLGVGDSVEVRGVKTTLNEVRTLPVTDLD